MSPEKETPNLARRESDGIVVKAFGHIDIKDEGKGEVEAVIATLNVVDREGDVILPTAIKSGSKVIMSSYNHNTVGSLFGDSGQFPAGKGKIDIDGDKAVFRGNVFMDMQLGRDTLAMLKHMGGDQEWSFGFRVLDSDVPDKEQREKWPSAERILTKLDCFEVSPVIMGAGVGTRTLVAKQASDEAEAARRRAEEESVVAERVERERQAAETKALEEQKVRVKEAMEEYHRVQRTLKRLNVA